MLKLPLLLALFSSSVTDLLPQPVELDVMTVAQAWALNGQRVVTSFTISCPPDTHGETTVIGAGHDEVKVELEGLQGTYDRLLKAFAEGDGEDIQKQILEQNKGFNQKLDRVRDALVNGFNSLGRELGVVGP